MCGRYVSARDSSQIVEDLGVDWVDPLAPGPSWNVAPSQAVRVVLDRASEDGEVQRVLTAARWGLIPSWATSAPARLMINARSETLTEKPSFAASARKSRALIPADGFYEWATVQGVKTPWYFTSADAQVMTFAAITSWWRDQRVPVDQPGSWVFSTAVITRPGTDLTGGVHDRSPLVIPVDLREQWLTPSALSAAQVQSLVDLTPDPLFVPREVGTDVGNVRHDHPGLIEPVPTRD